MTDNVRVFIDEEAVSVPAGIPIHQAIALFDPALAAALNDGNAYLTDGVGRRLVPDTLVSGGAIIRVIRSSRPPDERGAD